MIITTTATIENHKISAYKGIVTGEVIVGANVIKDVFASFTDFFGGRSGAYEKALSDARETALHEMKQQAEQHGADAIVGVDIDYETIRSGMLMVTASGTAVSFSK